MKAVYGPGAQDWKPERRMRFARLVRETVTDKLRHVQDRNPKANADVRNGGLDASVTVWWDGFTEAEGANLIETMDRVYAQVMTHERGTTEDLE